jgi:hypothetical protein
MWFCEVAMAENVQVLNAEIQELRGLLRLFAFPAYPDLFQSLDGGCTEVILPDESVQRVRAYFGNRAF